MIRVSSHFSPFPFVDATLFSLQGGSIISVGGGLPASGPSNSVLGGHRLHSHSGPIGTAAPDFTIHLRSGGGERRGWGAGALPVCCVGTLGSRQNHFHGHPVWPQARCRCASGVTVQGQGLESVQISSPITP